MQQLAKELLTNKASRDDAHVLFSASQAEFNPWHSVDEA